MRVLHYRDAVIAATDHDGSGAVEIEWNDIDDANRLVPSGDKCDGWIEGEGASAVLFAPNDGQAAPGLNIEEDGRPCPYANWYCVGTGERAVLFPAGVFEVSLTVMGYRGDPSTGLLHEDERRAR